MVLQDTWLKNASIRDNIAFGVEGATLEKVRQAAEVAHADEFINEMPAGYDTNIGDRGGKLSGGQRQRLSIARAVYKNPPDPHPRRSHFGSRYQERAPCAECLGSPHGGTYDHRHRPPPLDDHPC